MRFSSTSLSAIGLTIACAIGADAARADEPATEPEDAPSAVPSPSASPSTTNAPAKQPEPANPADPANPRHYATVGYVPDTVFLKSGGLVRGAIVENLPGDHVTVAMPTGEDRRIAWAEVDRVASGRDALPAQAPAPETAAPPPEPKKRGPLVRVHIASEESVLLDRRPAGEDAWVPACASPCDEDFPLGDTYRVSGAGLRATNEFRLAGAENGRVVLNIDGATKRAWWIGAGVGGMGVVLDFYGLYIAFLGTAIANSSCRDVFASAQSCANAQSNGTTLRNVGLVMLIPGTAAAIVGGAMMVRNWRSGLTQSEGDSSAQARPLDAFRRAAEARTPTAVDAAPPATFFPLTQGTF